MNKKLITCLIGLSFLTLPLAASAQMSAASDTNTNASLIALYTQLIHLLQEEIQLLQGGSHVPPPSPTPTPSGDTALTADPSSGPAPLAVSFTGTGVKGGTQYIIDYGDGQNSGPLAALDVCMHLSDGSGGCPKAQASHTYAAAGMYTATLQSYISCMWSNPRCMIATMPLASATITISSSSPQGYGIACAPGYHASASTPPQCVPNGQ